MISPGRIFNTPPGVRMSPGRRRAFYGPTSNLRSLHAALTRVSAALAEERNLHARMTEAGIQKENTRKRHKNLVNKLSSIRQRMRRSPLAVAAFQQQLNQVQKEINAILPNVHNKKRQSNKLVKQWENSKKRYHQLARRVIYHNGSRNLNSRPLTIREREAIRASGPIVRNMSAARRTVRHFPLPQNLGMLIIRSAARR